MLLIPSVLTGQSEFHLKPVEPEESEDVESGKNSTTLPNIEKTCRLVFKIVESYIGNAASKFSINGGLRCDNR